MNRLDALAVDLGGTHLVEASAGTGKTTTIATLVLRLVVELEIEVPKILVVTYTRPATAELRLRIRARLRDARRALEGTPDGEPPLDDLLHGVLDRWREAGIASRARRTLASALAEFDEAPITTIHSFCQRILQEHAFESGAPFGAELVADQRPFQREIVLDLWERALANRPEAVAREVAGMLGEDAIRFVVESALSKRRARLEPGDVGDPLREEDLEACRTKKERRRLLERECVRVYRWIAIEARREATRRKAAANVQSFDDLLYGLDEALAADEASGGALLRQVRAQTSAALIDEFQDTDPVQLEVFRRLFVGRIPFFAIGDPKQSIFAFQGADLEAYVSARRKLSPVEHTLGSNWRSDAGLVAAVNALFESHPRPFGRKGIGFDAVAAERPDRATGLGKPLRFLFVDRTDSRVGRRGSIVGDWYQGHLPRAIAAEVVRFLQSGAEIEGRRLRAGDVAILCRTNERLRQIRECLREAGVPAVIQGATSVFDDAEAVEMERVLSALADPADPRAVRSALATSLLGWTGDAIFALASDEAGWDAQTARFRGWHETWLRRGFAAAFHEVLAGSDAYERLGRRTGGERRLTNFLHLAELVQAHEVASRSGPMAQVEWMRRLREDRDARGELGEDAAQVRLESDEDAVKLVTIHRAKGLEWPVVICPDLWIGAKLRGAEVKFPRHHVATADGDRELVIDLGSEDRDRAKAAATVETLEEHLRLLYVAITRARHHCTVVWGHFQDGETSPLAYLLHLGDVEAEGPELLAQASARWDALDDRAMRAALARVSRRSGHHVAVERLVEQGVLPWAAPTAVPSVLEARRLERPIRDDWRASSFSGLVRAGGRLSRLDEEGRDRDQVAAERRRSGAAPPTAQGRVPLHDFPAGPNAGNCVHALLEEIDFAAGAAEIATAAEALLPRFGLSRDWAARLGEAIEALLATPIAAGDRRISLRAIGASSRRSEMEFVLPVESLDPPTLGGIFERHRAPRDDPRYGRRVAALGFEAFAGFLRGAIDLVFEHDGRWWLLDWKSNHLGPGPADYEAEKLAAEMVNHDYHLQSHLYAVAVHRHLSARLPGYDYERDFGGVLYLFVRGIDPRHAVGTGTYFERPARALIEELSATLGHEERAA